MRAITTTEFVAMQETQESAMFDACKIGTLAQTQSGPYLSDGYTYGAEIACGVDQMPSGDVGGGEATDGSEAGLLGAVFRLPHGTAITSASRVRVTKRQGVVVTNEDYSIIGDPHVGPTCTVVKAKRVHGSRRG